ncbi:MAG TPA: Gfo/Idh/MocA family oxidoreductase [Gemmatimonadales bacterium]|nr:Gfo/Idh/MocA family oxidoreductase [Gemmatimonadales bacterium]
MSETVTPVRWGVLGAAGIALRSVIPAMQRSPWSPVVAIASRDPGKARAAAEAHGIPRHYGAYAELLADPAVDAVYIPLPNHLHVPWSIRAAEAGKHVLCEKPIALSAAEARELIAVRARTGVLVGEAFMVRCHPRWHAARELARSGRIGDLRLITGHFSYFRRDRGDIRTHREWGGGALLDIGSYPVTLSRWIFGAEPVAVNALVERDPEFGIDRLTSAVLRFPAGVATFTCGGQLVLHQHLHLLGTRGRIEVAIPFNMPADRPSRIVVDDGRDLVGGGVETIEFPPANPYLLQGERFSRAIRGHDTVPVALEDSVANMAVLDALFRSGESGSWENPARF